MSKEYKLLAYTYFISAKALKERFRIDSLLCENSHNAYPFFYLISHSLELYLKGHLHSQGYKGNLKKIGHNLNKLMKECENCKNALIFTNEEKITISLFNDFNEKDYLLKYPGDYSCYGYAFDFFIISELIEKLDLENPPTFFKSKDYLAPKTCFIVEK